MIKNFVRILSIKLFLTLLTFSTVALADNNQGNGPTASRKAEKGCSWFTIQSIDPKFSVLAQDCDYGFRKITHSFEGRALIQNYSDQPESSEPNKVIRLFGKLTADSPKAALTRLFIDNLEPYEKDHCIAVQATSKQIAGIHLTDPSKTIWVITPDKEYAAKIKGETAEGDMPENSCGYYGLPVDSVAYFEFHSKNPGMFAWVVIGQDTPLFDEQSLKF